MRWPRDDRRDLRRVQHRHGGEGELRDTNILVNAACPGYCATDLNGFRGVRTPEEGAAIAIRLAALPDDGPTGRFFDDDGEVPW